MIKVHGPFFVKGRWLWITFETRDANLHASMHACAIALGATAWDTSQASMLINGSCVQGHPTAFG